MLKTVETINALAESLKREAGSITADAKAAIDDLTGFRAWAVKTRASIDERGKAVCEAITADHVLMDGEFAEMIAKADALIDKLNGAASEPDLFVKAA